MVDVFERARVVTVTERLFVLLASIVALIRHLPEKAMAVADTCSESPLCVWDRV